MYEAKMNFEYTSVSRPPVSLHTFNDVIVPNNIGSSFTKRI